MHYTNTIAPIFIAHDRLSFNRGASSEIFAELKQIECQLVGSNDSFVVEGFCIPCSKTVPFIVDGLAGGSLDGEVFLPNWRERLVCPCCHMSNRQRLMAALVVQQLRYFSGKLIYLMEQTTSLYRWVVEHLTAQTIIGSEYLGEGYRSGETIKAWRHHTSWRNGTLFRTLRHKARLFYSMIRMGGIRQEDVTALSFENDTLDLIVSNDVFEHVPEPRKAFMECARVLRPGGLMLASIPFHNHYDFSIQRAEWGPKGLRHLQPPVYHGNPVSVEGALVFTDFGWDLISCLREAGFSDVTVEAYASAKFGHLGGGQLIFRMKR